MRATCSFRAVLRDRTSSDVIFPDMINLDSSSLASSRVCVCLAIVLGVLCTEVIPLFAGVFGIAPDADWSCFGFVCVVFTETLDDSSIFVFSMAAMVTFQRNFLLRFGGDPLFFDCLCFLSILLC